jgi:predicted O-methyltransferase YrrM
LEVPQAFDPDWRVIEMSAPDRHYVGKDVAHKITQLYGNAMTFDFTPYRGSVDIVFVDAAHHYAAAKSDSENAIAMLRPGGVALWHDFANYGDYNDVTRAVLDTVPPQEVVQLENTQLALYRKPS